MHLGHKRYAVLHLLQNGDEWKLWTTTWTRRGADKEAVLPHLPRGLRNALLGSVIEETIIVRNNEEGKALAERLLRKFIDQRNQG